jgi:peptide/nickel transport system substrate-binding protein
MLFTSFSSFDFVDPSAHFPLRGNGLQAWPGWPTIPRLEQLRDAWFVAPDLASQQRIAREIQTIAMDELPYVPVGSYLPITALRRNLADRVAGMQLFWGLRRT